MPQDPKPRWFTSRWALGFAVFTLLGTLSFLYHFLDDRTAGVSGTAGIRALEEYTGAYSAALLFLGVVWMARRFPLRPHAWRRSLSAYLLALPLFGFLFTTLMLAGRALLAPWLGLGPYHAGDLWYRYPMEFANQVGVYAVMVGAVWLRDLYQENRRRELAAARLREQLVRAQLEQLRLRLQPHFLFNTLNTIASVMYEDLPRAEAMLTGLATLLRHTLETQAGDSGEITLAQEVQTCRLYTELMRARFEHTLDVTYAIAPQAESARVPPFLLQPLLENALRHGGSPILVQATVAAQELLLEVHDAGRACGAALAAAAGEGHGLGLGSTGERLRQMYGEAHRFQFGPEPSGGFAVRLTLPLRP